MRTVHLAVLFGVDLDYDLAGHFIEHYARHRYTSRTVVYHKSKDKERNREVSEKFRSGGWVEFYIEDIVNGGVEFDSPNEYGRRMGGRMRQSAMLFVRSTLPPGSIFCTVDSDEFQDLPENYIPLLESGEVDVVTGLFLDRWADRLKNAVANVPLEEQYPIFGDFSKEFAKTVEPEDRCYVVNIRKEKILAAPVDADVAFVGSHFIHTMRYNWKVYPKVIDVVHYSYRETYLARCSTKMYYSAAYLWYAFLFFGGDPNNIPPILQKKIAEEEQRKLFIPVVAVNEEDNYR